MRHYAAREIGSDDKSKLWYYTVEEYGRIRPVGYCSPWKTCPECLGDHDIEANKTNGICRTCNNVGLVKKENPCPGHATSQEACEHFRQFVLDGVEWVQLHPDDWSSQRCVAEGCDVKVHWMARNAPYLTRFTCTKHRTREVLQTVVADLYVGMQLS